MNVTIASAQNRGGSLESGNTTRVPLVATPTSRSATPFDKGEYGTDEMLPTSGMEMERKEIGPE